MNKEVSISQLIGFKRFKSEDENITKITSENRYLKRILKTFFIKILKKKILILSPVWAQVKRMLLLKQLMIAVRE